MVTQARSIHRFTGIVLATLLCCFCPSCDWRPGKEVNQKLGALLRGAGSAPVRLQIDGQGKQAVITDASTLHYLANALAGAKQTWSPEGVSLYDAVFVFPDSQTSICRIRPYANLDGMQILVLWHEFDDDEVKYDVPFRGEVPTELHRVLKNLAAFEQTKPTSAKKE